MPRIEIGVLNIRSIITRCHSVSQHRTSGVNADNLITLTNSSHWSLQNVNARWLSIEKLDELLVVARMNDVACVNVTETWFKSFMASGSVGLAGLFYERKDRVERGGGWVACGRDHGVWSVERTRVRILLLSFRSIGNLDHPHVATVHSGI